MIPSNCELRQNFLKKLFKIASGQVFGRSKERRMTIRSIKTEITTGGNQIFSCLPGCVWRSIKTETTSWDNYVFARLPEHTWSSVPLYLCEVGNSCATVMLLRFPNNAVYLDFSRRRMKSQHHISSRFPTYILSLGYPLH